MSWPKRLRNVFRTERLNDELETELAFHMAETVDRLVAEGCSPKEAEKQAQRLLGNHTLQKERTREMDLLGWLEAALSDVKYGLRQMKLNPGFAAVAVLSLALGIGANTAIFQLLDAIRLRGLPVRDPSQLVTIERGNPQEFFVEGKYVSREQAFTYAQMEALKKRQQAFSDVLTFWPTRLNLSSSGRSRFAEALLVSTNYLDVLGITPVLGRGFAKESDTTACSQGTAVLSYSFWQAEFGADRNVIGRSINLDGHQFPIGGVTPASFLGLEPGERFDVALPLCASNVFAGDGKGPAFDRVFFWLTPIGRLKPGWSVERAAKHVYNLSAAIFAETVPSEYRPDLVQRYLKNKLSVVPASAGVSPLRQQFVNPLWILMAITGSVLLIACANLANLLLARATAREREIAVRQAVGASRTRLLLQLLTESLLLAGSGALLGICLAQALSGALVRFLNTDGNPVVLATGLDWHVFGFLALLAFATCVLFGLAPAARASGGTPAAAMRGSRTSTANRERNGLRRILVTSQIALAVVLLVAALLFTRSLRKLLGADLGFDSQNVVIAHVNEKALDAAPNEKKRAWQRALEDQIRSLSEVSSVSTAAFTPFSGSGWRDAVFSSADKPQGTRKLSWFNRVGPGYFATLGTPLLAGREFTAHDDLNAPKVAIVNAAFVKHVLGGGNAIGKTFRVEGNAGAPDDVYQVVGVVHARTYNDAKEADPDIAFLSAAQDSQPGSNLSLVVRGRGSPESLESAIQKRIGRLDPGALVDFKVLAVQVKDSLLLERLMANLSLGFGVLAGCLSTLGLYGVMSYLVTRRSNEIGVRIALGASRVNVYRLVARDAGLMVGLGLVVGIGSSVVLSRFAEALLFGVKGTDPISLSLAALALAATAGLATFIPARRAAGVEPTVALRAE